MYPEMDHDAPRQVAAAILKLSRDPAAALGLSGRSRNGPLGSLALLQRTEHHRRSCSWSTTACFVAWGAASPTGRSCAWTHASNDATPAILKKLSGTVSQAPGVLTHSSNQGIYASFHDLFRFRARHTYLPHRVGRAVRLAANLVKMLAALQGRCRFGCRSTSQSQRGL